MKKIIFTSIALVAMALMFTSCSNPYNKMKQDVNTINAKSNPEVLTLVGNTVAADVTVTFPQKYFGKGMILKVTPSLKFEGGAINGTAKFFQGEKVKDNYTVVPTKEGGTHKFRVELPYDSRANISTLELVIEGRYAENKKEALREFAPFGALTVATGVVTTQSLAKPATALMPNNFSRVNTVTQTADIRYQVSSSTVNRSQLSSDQVKALQQFIKDNQGKENVIVGNVQAKGFASPEGPEKFNDKLSASRSKTGKDAFNRQMKGTKVKYDEAAYGEDWEGFKKLVEASNIADKDLILQVLAMYDSSAKRDQEIKNLSQVFTELKKTILPELRRTQLVASVDVIGMSDEQLIAAVNAKDANLTANEILYAAELVEPSKRLEAYKFAVAQYPNDVRTHNNLGATLLESGDVAGAKASFEQAAKLGNCKVITNNMAAVAIAQGDFKTAKQYLMNAEGEQANHNKALVTMSEGNYAAASKGLEGYNLAVSQVLEGKYDAAKASLKSVDSGDADYLRATIAMRQGDSKGAIANLKSAIAKQPELRAKAKADAEFRKIFEMPEFKGL